MNAIDFLLNEHDNVRKMLADISDDSHRHETKKNLFHKLSEMLIRHELMEENIWYPNFKSKLSETVKHLVSEEKHAEKAIKKIIAIDDQKEWEKNFVKFKTDVEHHADEEETKLFPEVKKLLSAEQLEEIGKKMYAFKKEYPG